MSPYGISLALASALAAFGIAASGASAQDLSSTISCLKGSVRPYDYSELSQNMHDNFWDRKSGISLSADGEGSTLKVTDSSGTSVCTDAASDKATCTFRLNNSNLGDFVIRVDNVGNSLPIQYNLCAF